MTMEEGEIEIVVQFFAENSGQRQPMFYLKGFELVLPGGIGGGV